MSIPYLLQLSADNAELQSQLEMFGLIGGGTYAVVFVLFAASLVGMWKMFVKAGKPGWAAIVPLYSDAVLVEICGLPATYKYYLWLSLALIPLGGCFGVFIIAGIIVRYFMLRVLLASFGRPNEPLNVVGALLFPYVTYPSIGFGSDTYLGVQAAAVAAAPKLPWIGQSAAPAAPVAAPASSVPTMSGSAPSENSDKPNNENPVQ
jgi:hypothetical protein